MVRQLEKIEKEMGYCDIKLEKERRLRQQAKYLYAEAEAMERFVKRYESSVRGLGQLQYEKIAQQVSLEKARTDKVGPFFHRAKEDFISAGILEMVRQESATLTRERQAIEAKLSSFTGFGQKRNILEEEHDSALSSLAPAHSSKVRRVAGEFKRVEREWNALTEDAINFDEGLFYLARNVDYLKSARAFLIAAKGSFDLESWAESGFATDLFRHSNVGRAKEMIDGANRNLKLAQKELFCISNLKIRLEGFESMLVSFLDGLFDDIFLDGRLGRAIHVVEEAQLVAEKNLAQVRQKRETLHARLERVDDLRGQLFHRLVGRGEARGGAVPRL